jgi:hypothetical protein
VEGGVHKQDHVTPVCGVATSVLCGGKWEAYWRRDYLS